MAVIKHDVYACISALFQSISTNRKPCMLGVNALRIVTFQTGWFNQTCLKLIIPNWLFRVSGEVCCDGFMLNQSTGLCQSKCFKDIFEFKWYIYEYHVK